MTRPQSQRLDSLANGQQRSTTMTMPNTEASGSRGANADQQAGGSAREQIRDVKDQVVGQARNTLQQARDRASSSLGESKGQVADQFSTIADALRRTTEHLRSEDQQRIAGLTESLARQVDQVANYLRNKDARAMRADLENLARRQPAIVVGGALVLGLIGARFLKSSQRERRSREIRRHMPETASGYQGGGYAGA
jgi:sirohydrochlorin ferrochelatase